MTASGGDPQSPVKVSVLGGGGREVVLRIPGPGELVGETVGHLCSAALGNRDRG